MPGKENTPPDGIIRFVVENASLITTDGHRYSPVVVVRGVPWKVNVWSDDSIGMGITCMHTESTPWSIAADVEFILVHPDNNKNITVRKSFLFGQAKRSGAVMYKRLERINIDKGFINDDKITVEAHLWISKLRGIKLNVGRQIDFTASNEPYHDVTLVIGGEKLYVSKQILAFQSPVFKAMFYGKFAEKKNKEIELKGVNREEFIELLQVIYPTGRNITDESVTFLLKLGNRFQIEYIIERAELVLIESQKFSNVEKLKFVDQYRLPVLQKRCLSELKTTQDCKDLMKSPIYHSLSDAMKIAILEPHLMRSN
ncbi:hypothetical protein PMAYCL1PPCAC_25212 [Pristionchus mayeri]|uniref:BTB domain-containing protein n=1 Tax=Pristionchus mayeri TaxID=1317129 RepID=A0AAN5I750_9BILA|nr:hypothetical protein PMAYCL1PPCAC_25212 [Pristionchus mayeri]